MMSRAQLYAALSDEPKPDGSRSNPLKGKFFFGSTLRLYGGSRWSELRRKSQDETVAGRVAISDDFEFDEEIEMKSKRAKTCDPARIDDDKAKLQDETVVREVATSDEFEFHEESDIKFNRAKSYEPAIIDKDKTKLATKALGKFVDLLRKKPPYQHVELIKGYQGNWKASQPAFIVITNPLFTGHC
jgi:hypothetical protein